MSLKDEAIKRIPKGIYCYERLQMNEDKITLSCIGMCPFFHYNEFLHLYYCEFLNEFGLPNNITAEEYQNLIEHFGSEEELFKNVPLDLLFDQCKECGENKDETN